MRFRRKLTPVGIDWGGRSVKAVQLAQTRDGWAAHAAATVPLPQPNAPADAATIRRLRDVLYRRGFEGDGVVLAAPTSRLEVDVFDLPPRSSGAPLEQFARTELARSARIEEHSFEMTCWDLPAPARAAASTSVMAVGLRHEDGEALVSAFEDEGLDVRAIDTRALALARACAPLLRGSDVSAILDLGWNSAFLVLMCDNVVIYQRALAETGFALAHRQLVSRFQLADDVAEEMLQVADIRPVHPDNRRTGGGTTAVRDLVGRHIDSVLAEVDVSLAYARHRYPARAMTTLLLAGGGAGIAGIEEHVAERLNVSVKVAAASQLAVFPRALDGSGGPALAAAIGLARHDEEAR